MNRSSLPTSKNYRWLYLFGGFILFLAYNELGTDLAEMSVMEKGKSLDSLPVSRQEWLKLFWQSVIFVAVLLGILDYHQRRFMTLVAVGRGVKWREFWFGLVVYSTIAVVVNLTWYFFNPATYEYSSTNIQWLEWLKTMIVFTIPIVIHAIIEELLFRGYLLTGLSAQKDFRSPSAILLSSLLFALAHFRNSEVEAAPAIVLGAHLAAGIFYAAVASVSAGIEMACGTHIANNLVVAFVFNPEKTSVEASSLFVRDQLYAGEETIMALAIYLIFGCCLYFSRLKERRSRS